MGNLSRHHDYIPIVPNAPLVAVPPQRSDKAEDAAVPYVPRSSSDFWQLIEAWTDNRTAVGDRRK